MGARVPLGPQARGQRGACPPTDPGGTALGPPPRAPGEGRDMDSAKRRGCGIDVSKTARRTCATDGASVRGRARSGARGLRLARWCMEATGGSRSPSRALAARLRWRRQPAPDRDFARATGRKTIASTRGHHPLRERVSRTAPHCRCRGWRGKNSSPPTPDVEMRARKPIAAGGRSQRRPPIAQPAGPRGSARPRSRHRHRLRARGWRRRRSPPQRPASGHRPAPHAMTELGRSTA